MKKDLLALLKTFFRKHRRLPSYAEMLTLFGFSSKKSIFDHVHTWIEQGFLKKEAGKLAPTARFFSIPLVGMVQAGYPILAEENRSYLTLDEYLIDDPNTSFLLKVSGDSRMGAGIFDGDLVIVKRTQEALPGAVVLAEIDHEWTLKILRREKRGKRMYLEAANPKYPPFYPQKELSICGVVKAVVRKLRAIH